MMIYCPCLQPKVIWDNPYWYFYNRHYRSSFQQLGFRPDSHDNQCMRRPAEYGKDTEETARRKRGKVHLSLSVLLAFFICLVEILNNKSVIDAIYIIASYTYGPLLGMFAFGLFTRRQTNDRWVPLIAIFSPLLCYLADWWIGKETGYKFGYELLMLNGTLTFAGLICMSKKGKRCYKEINDKKMEITSAEFVISNTDVKKCPAGIFPEYAFIGRSNVGKSSLINMLTSRKGLAMTSSTPGKRC